MEQSACSSRPRDETEFNFKERCAKTKINRENTNSRRFSASYIKSFREDTKSFRSNITISSTAASAGYTSKDEIDPSTYSFTTALQALQANSTYNNWECSSPDGLVLNSKWNEAEKYICNPLSGEFPKECLSSKTPSARSFRNLTNRITMSASLTYSSHSRKLQTKPSINTPHDENTLHHFPIPEKKMEGMSMTRDVGTQSTPPNQSSSSPSPASTPLIIERSLKRVGFEGDSPHSNAKTKSEDEVKMEETRKEEETKREDKEKEKEKEKRRQGGCFTWMRKRQREKHKQRKRNVFLPSLIGC